MRSSFRTVLAGTFATFAVGCASVDSKGERAEGFNSQAVKGAALFEGHCASCHGALGHGTDKGPAVVGLKDGALPLDPPADRKKRTMQFRTLADVARFVIKYMPGDDPGAMAEDDYFRIVAFDLRANGIDLDKHLDMELAETIVLPREAAK